MKLANYQSWTTRDIWSILDLEIYISKTHKLDFQCYSIISIANLSQGFLAVFALNSRESFVNMSTLLAQLNQVKDVDKVPIVLCGNKCDLPQNLKEVSEDEGAALAAKIGSPYFSTSAKVSFSFHPFF